ncbi:multidrug efflux SMR transporter [Yinghuangia sp. ASG 101]|uniref:DMT family transporter n=1 Tax=Yinghuangia sp. ASG 101 TaxID=2896848 RepID=UPI001E493E20|nr:multidrug efflux SMR transporter [Yinghuangia sp. ASG 101]UGQ14910.1 multidrug efflux SMR transporter [Yinghuangia sp. ASG 101]
MAWVLVVIAGCLETGFALLLKASDGFTKLWPTIGFAICAISSFGLLTLSLKTLDVGPAYAVWTGIGAAGTAIMGIWLYGESSSVLKLISIALILAGVVGLNLSGISH